MAKMDQPLLNSPRRTCPSSKTVFITLSLSTFFSLLVLLANHVNTKNHHLHLCKVSSNPASCQAIISQHSFAGIFRRSDADLLQILLKDSASRVDDIAGELHGRLNDSNRQVGLANCAEFMELSRGRLSSVINSLRAQSGGPITGSGTDDVYAYLAGVLANHVTCLDGLDDGARPALEAQLKTLIDLSMASLAIFGSLSPSSVGQLQDQRAGDFPPWLSVEDRMAVRARRGEIAAHVVVAKDGSGNYRTIQEAVDEAPENGEARHVIYVRRGRYEEKVVVGRSKKNLLIVGDGMDSTIVTGRMSAGDGSTVFSSATFVVLGDGFMVQDICIENTATPEEGQAVALLVAADQSVINRCRVDGYHNTLWAHSLRQLYRDCMISGTKDFVFGNAISVLQNCRLIAQEPIAN